MYICMQISNYKAEPSEITMQSGKGATKLTKTAGAANNFLKQIYNIHNPHSVAKRTQSQSRWWAHTNIPRAHLMLQSNLQDQSSGQDITRGISSAPRARAFWAAPRQIRRQHLLHPQIKQKTRIFIKTKKY